MPSLHNTVAAAAMGAEASATAGLAEVSATAGLAEVASQAGVQPLRLTRLPGAALLAVALSLASAVTGLLASARPRLALAWASGPTAITTTTRATSGRRTATDGF